MTPHAQRPSAILYNFAERARSIRAARGGASEPAARAMPATACGTGSYHEAALREVDPTRKP